MSNKNKYLLYAVAWMIALFGTMWFNSWFAGTLPNPLPEDLEIIVAIVVVPSFALVAISLAMFFLNLAFYNREITKRRGGAK